MKRAIRWADGFTRVRGAVAACGACAVLCGCAAIPALRAAQGVEAARGAEGEDLSKLHGIIDRAVEQYGKVREYRCIFQKRQRIGGTLQPPQRMVFKFRAPMNLYMKWLSEPHKGQEILYAPSRYGKKALARAGGWKGAVTPPIHIDVDGYWVMRDNIHPLNHAGIGYFLDLFMKNAKRAREEKASALIDRGVQMVAGRPARLLESVLPNDKAKGYYCYRCLVWFDEEHGLPVQVSIYDWDDNLSEEYLYVDLDLDPGFTDRDFDRHNPDYHL